MRDVPGSGADGGTRSSAWFDRNDLEGLLHRSWPRSTGVGDEAFRGRTVIGICNSRRELVSCRRPPGFDLLRISDARMSGTSYGAVVLHVAPEAAVGGPLALVRTGDRIRPDVAPRTSCRRTTAATSTSCAARPASSREHVTYR